MNLKRVLNAVEVSPEPEEINEIKLAAGNITGELERAIRKLKIDADIFIGGSYAKGTLAKKEKHDIDIYVRFGTEYEDLSAHLEKIINKAFGKKRGSKKIHGSRDYFSVEWSKNIYFEIIPVLRIKHPREGRNVTDLSYFHVNYVKRNLRNKESAREVILAKTFLRAQRIYGAESYIQGFSGYAVECLIIYFRTFERMLKGLSGETQRIIIDSEKRYKKREDVLFSINESKLGSPVILVDPTWKERNVLAALSRETFEKFRLKAREFLKEPSTKFFEPEKMDLNAFGNIAKKEEAELIKINLNTKKQAGDIAGTKLKKFSRFMTLEISKYFEVIKDEFLYDGGQKADLYLILKNKGEIIKIGPPVDMLDAVEKFRSKNPEAYEQNGYLHSRIKLDGSAGSFLRKWAVRNKRKIKEMDAKIVKIA